MRRYAGVDHRDADAGAVVAQLLPDGGRADGGAGALHRSDDHAVEGDPRHLGTAGDARQRGVGEIEDDAIGER